MLRVDAYIRVSRVANRQGPRFISPDVQRDEIARWAQSRRAEVLQVFQELDESGARYDRSLVHEAIRRVEAGLSDGIVVSKVSRFSRSSSDGAFLIERIRKAGGRFFSVLDGLDTGTATGRLVAKIMLDFAEFDLEGTRAEWEAARERAVQRGVFVGSIVPVGYRRTRAGRLRIVPATAEVVREVFVRRARGATVASLSNLLEERGIRTAVGKPWVVQKRGGWPVTRSRYGPSC